MSLKRYLLEMDEAEADLLASIIGGMAEHGEATHEDLMAEAVSAFKDGRHGESLAAEKKAKPYFEAASALRSLLDKIKPNGEAH